MKSVYTELRFTGIYSIINPERGGGKKTAAISQTVQYAFNSPKAKITLVFLFLGPCLHLVSYIYKQT